MARMVESSPPMAPTGEGLRPGEAIQEEPRHCTEGERRDRPHGAGGRSTWAILPHSLPSALQSATLTGGARDRKVEQLHVHWHADSKPQGPVKWPPHCRRQG